MTASKILPSQMQVANNKNLWDFLEVTTIIFLIFFCITFRANQQINCGRINIILLAKSDENKLIANHIIIQFIYNAHEFNVISEIFEKKPTE